MGNGNALVMSNTSWRMARVYASHQPAATIGYVPIRSTNWFMQTRSGFSGAIVEVRGPGNCCWCKANFLRGTDPPGSLVPRTPPSFRQIAGSRRCVGASDSLPSDDPLFRQVEEGDRVVARDQDTIKRAHGGDEFVAAIGIEQGGDHLSDGRAFDPHIITGALGIRRRGSPVERLLVAWRKRL